MSLDPDTVRRSYDRLAARYAEELGDELNYKPLDRALLSVLADDVNRRGQGLIGDLGAGPGHVAAHLAKLGTDVVALDLSPAMVALGHHRGLATLAGSLASLPLRTASLGGAVVFYSLIHLDDRNLDAAVVELARVVAHDGAVLIAFHTGDQVIHRDELWGKQVDLDFRFLQPAVIVDRLQRAGFAVEATLSRASYPEEVATQRTYVLARRQRAQPSQQQK